MVVAGVIAAVIVIKVMWKKPTPIEVAAAASEMDASNPRNGPSLLARARVVNLLHGRKKRVVEGKNSKQ